MVGNVPTHFREWRIKARRERERLFDDWLLNDALQEAWRIRILSTLSLIFTFFAFVNGGMAVKTYLDFPEFQTWQFQLLITSSVYWCILMVAGWRLARRGQTQKTIYLMLLLFLIGPTGFGGIGIEGFGEFYNAPLLVLSVIFVSLLSKRREQQTLILAVIVVWFVFILFQYFFDAKIKIPIPPLMERLAPGAFTSTIIFYTILILQFYRLSVPNKILMSFLTALQVMHQAILAYTKVILANYLPQTMIVQFVSEMQFVLYFLIGGVTLAILLVTRAISNPLTQLTSTAIRVSEGDLQTRADLISIDEIGELAKVFNQVISRLSTTLDGLEQKVEERTRDLNVASQVSRQITQVLRLDELLPRLVEETKAGFGLYFTSVYLFNAKSKQLTLAAGSGEAGARMKAEGKVYDITARPSIVARAARELTPVVIEDVSVSASFNPNPYLPETRSEAAIPMITQGELVGILGMQSIELNDFSEDDLRILTSLSEQIAVAVRNAELYENQIRVADELKRVDDLKNQFLASMSHELRTPLNAIINYVAMVADGMMGNVNDEQKELLDGAVKSSRHLLHLINDVLDISKIQAGKLTLYREEDVNLKTEIESSLSIASAMILSKPLEIIKEVDDDLPLISGDKRRIRQIILNLVSNAIKFTDQGLITLKATQTGSEILISVKDSGPGIAPDAQNLIFEPFTQTKSGIKLEGTGLGLPISRTLAQLHGGRLWVKSEPNQGATFYLTLPIHGNRPQ